jgi:hypothetical protein
MRNLNMSYDTLSKMSVRYRTWFIERLVRELSPKKTTNTGGIEIDDDTPISAVLGRMNT